MLAVITSLAMTGCGETESSDEQKDSVSADNQVSQQEESVKADDSMEEIKEEETEPPKKTIEMSDNLSDFTFTLDEIVYSLPCQVSDFLDNGWTVKADTGKSENDNIVADDTDYIYIVKGENKVTINFKNISGNVKKVSECQAYSLDLFSDYVDNSIFTMSKNIGITSSYDDVITAFGVPTETKENKSEYTNYEEIKYEVDDSYSGVTFRYNVKDDNSKELSYIKMTNKLKSEMNNADTSEEVPEYLSEYQQPLQLGDDAFSGNIEIGGKLYNLPSPLSEFLDDGWDFDKNNKPNAIKAKNKDTFFLKRDNEKLHVIVYNFADYQTIPENCAVAGISADNGNDVSIVLPGGISLDSTKNDVESWLPDDFEKSEINNFYFYSKTVYQDILENADYVQRVSVSVPEDTGKVVSINVEFIK